MEIAFILILVLIVFLFLVYHFWQKEQRKNMPDDPNYVEPTGTFEESETNEINDTSNN